MKLKKGVLALCLVFSGLMTFAQEQDVDGSQDHPLLTRMNNFYIGDYETNFDRVDMYNSDGSERPVEGQRTTIHYYFKESSGAKNPSLFQILKNYDVAIKKIGGKVTHTDNSSLATYVIRKNGSETWVKVQAVNSGYVYYLTIVEVTEMEQEITANAIFEKLTTEGSISLYINFETGKSAIQGDSQPIIDEIVQMLKDNPSLKISIEGHTDNTGAAAANKTLSLNRAKSVATALTTKGIAASRITTTGWGQEKPIADNATEEGRAQNRRVQIVKL